VKATRAVALARKEWREIVRDRIFLSLAFLLPVVLMLVFGYGMSMDIDNVPLVVIDHDRTPSSRAYADRFAHLEHFDFRGLVDSEREGESLLASASAEVMLVIGPSFERELLSGHDVAVQALVDGSFPATRVPRALETYVDAVNTAATAELQSAWLVRRAAVSPERATAILHPVKLDVRYLFNSELRSIWSVAPSLIMFVLLFVAPMLMALGVVREKESGAIYNIYASTVTRGEFLLGKLAPNIVIGAVNAVLLWLIAVVHFGAPFKGSLACFAVGTFLYLVCTTSLGLVLSLLLRTQQTALMITSISATIIGFQYSGFFNPVQSLTGPSWVLAHAFPPMYYLDVVEGAFLKGMGFRGLWQDEVVLAAFGAGYVALAYALFRKRSAT
jgi:ABC-2 type transport system permease protein/ribosome-dependent ATPase